MRVLVEVTLEGGECVRLGFLASGAIHKIIRQAINPERRPRFYTMHTESGHLVGVGVRRGVGWSQELVKNVLRHTP